MNTAQDKLIPIIQASSQVLNGSENDYDDLLRDIGDSSIVLLGEATHGTHEFYQERFRITERLIREKGFMAVALEADWPDAYRLNRYVKLLSEENSPEEALGNFKRFPTWMWKNAEVAKFTAWLREWNQALPFKERVGVYGLDLYSLHASIEAVIRYLEKIDPEAAKVAKQRYGCFEHFDQDLQKYGFMANYGLSENCENEVVQQLMTLRQNAWQYLQGNSPVAEEEFFNAEMNARLAMNAEKYYRSMFQAHVSSWNLRDKHMYETVQALLSHLSQSYREAKVVLWAHNSHLGNASATDMKKTGEINIGELLKEKYKESVYAVGFSTYQGQVTAASEWDAPASIKSIRPALEESWELVFHETQMPAFILNLKRPELIAALNFSLLERAIGVIYSPHSERQSHYFEAYLTKQFDSIIHIDTTHALVPLEPNPEWQQTEDLPETYHFSL